MGAHEILGEEEGNGDGMRRQVRGLVDTRGEVRESYVYKKELFFFTRCYSCQLLLVEKSVAPLKGAWKK